MKSKILLFISLLYFGYTQAQTVTIPDPNFEAFLESNFGKNGPIDGFIDTTYWGSAITELVCENQNISSIKGIEHFPNLSQIVCLNNNISKIHLKNSNIKSIYCGSNPIDTIILDNVDLTIAHFDNNSTRYLKIINCDSLITIDLRLTALEELVCANNSNLITINSPMGNLTSVSVENLPSLSNLIITNTPLQILTISNLPDLYTLLINNNRLEELYIDNFPSLTFMNCNNNNLRKLGITNNPKLTTMLISNNNFDTLRIQSNQKLQNINMLNATVTYTNISDNESLHYISFYDNIRMRDLIVANNDSLKNLYVFKAKLESIQLQNLPLLEILDINENNLITLDLSAVPFIREVNAISNNLTNVRLENNLFLTKLRLANNNFVRFDASQAANLKELVLEDNQLRQVDLRNIDVDSVAIFVKNNPMLECAIVDDPSTMRLFVDSVMLDVKYTNEPCEIHNIQGMVFFDINKNCKYDSQDKLVPDISVSLYGTKQFEAITDKQGFFNFPIWENQTYSVKIMNLEKMNTTQNQCADFEKSITPNFNINNGDTLIYFPIQVDDFSLLSVSLSAPRLRRCFTNYLYVTVTNDGNLQAEDITVYLDLPEYVNISSTDESFEIIDEAEKIYAFSIDSLLGFGEKTLYIRDSVSCGNEDIRGYTQCISAWITPIPENQSILKAETNWDRSSIVVREKAECIHDTIAEFTISNAGDGDMVLAHDYRIYYNNELTATRSFRLESGEELKVRAPADGSTIRLEADQDFNHPGKSRPRTSIEGCGSPKPSEADLGFWPKSPLDNLNIWKDMKCIEIVDSYDPNEKSVTPQGVTENNYIPENERLHYTIRFQNTGSDVAYNINVIDTLSPFLDITTLEITGASHNYTYNLRADTVKILSFNFKNIMLPDSTSDEAGSHGFVNFTIYPKEGIEEKSIITNTADIYFDYNSPIRTNTTMVAPFDTIIVSQKKIIIQEIGNNLASHLDSLNISIRVFPNPTSNNLIIESTEILSLATISSINGQVVFMKNLHTSKSIISLSDLPQGMYFLVIRDSMNNEYSYKIIKQ